MLLNPPIMALVMVSTIVCIMLLLASVFAIRILRYWDITSGSEFQIRLEKQTWLINTLLAYAFAAELISLLLFIYNSEAMSSQFVGAMCATGVLNVNAYGWPTLFLKIGIFFAGAVWITLNHIDRQGYDYPLVKIKYGLLLLILPFALAEWFIQLRHFMEMDPDVITSCCGALFSADAEGVAGEVSGIKPGLAMRLLYGSGLAVLCSGIWYALRQRGGLLFAGFSLTAFFIALAGIVSFIALYIYEHPHHHCPFCILKSGHGYQGYFLYIPLFLATALSLGSGLLSQFKRIPSLKDAITRELPLLTWSALALFLLFYTLASWAVLSSNLKMENLW